MFEQCDRRTRRRRLLKLASSFLEKAKYQKIIEHLYGADTLKPSYTDWMTMQYREDSEGWYWVEEERRMVIG